METWKKIEGFESYEVSDWGRVRRGGRVLKGSINSCGYRHLRPSRDGVSVTKTIHRLVCIAFLPNPDAKHTINHIDHDKTNNRLENLEWATHSEQHIHSPKPVGKSGHRHILQTKNGLYKVKITRNSRCVFNKTFPTLPEAINARDEFM